MDRLLGSNWKLGVRDVGREIRKAEGRFDVPDEPMWIPASAVSWLKTRARLLIKGMDQQLTEVVRSSLMDSLKHGTPFRQTAAAIREALTPWLSDPTSLDPAAATPHRLETTVRTISTDAYNMGRLNNARRLPGVVVAMQYSAIIDDVTTDCCRFLDGKVFRVDDPDLDKLTPANHYRCRSVLVPVTVDIAPDPSGYITRAEKARALSLAHPRFIGPSG